MDRADRRARDRARADHGLRTADAGDAGLMVLLLRLTGLFDGSDNDWNLVDDGEVVGQSST